MEESLPLLQSNASAETAMQDYMTSDAQERNLMPIVLGTQFTTAMDLLLLNGSRHREYNHTITTVSQHFIEPLSCHAYHVVAGF